MKVMVMVKATPSSEQGIPPSQELLVAMGKFNEQLVEAGIMLAGEGLKPSSQGARVLFSGQNRTVTDGPFAETKELVAGYWLWQVKSMEDAITWVKRCPNPMLEDSEIEIRPVYSIEDFAEFDTTGEVAAGEEKMVREIENYRLEPRIEHLSAKTIAGVNQTYTFENRDTIPAQWEGFAPKIGSIPDQVGNTSYGVCWNFVPNQGFDYLTGVEISSTENLLDGFESVTLPAGKYLVFTHAKHISEIPQTIEAIWMKYLPNSSFEAAHTPAFERYTQEFDPQSGMGGTEIWVPLKS